MADLTKGFDELRQELTEYAKGASEPTRKQALDEGGKIFETRARSLAPRRFGTLQDKGIVRGNNSGDFIEIGWTKEGFYGRFLERGTSKMAPRPHIRPAYEQSKNQVAEIMLRKMKLK